MAALSVDRMTKKKNAVKVSDQPVLAATKVYMGSLVAKTTASGGYAVPAADAAGGIVLGVAYAQVDNSAGASGDKSVELEHGIFSFVVTGTFTIANVGAIAYVADDQTVQAAIGTNSVKAGLFLKYVSATEAWVKIDMAGLA